MGFLCCFQPAAAAELDELDKAADQPFPVPVKAGPANVTADQPSIVAVKAGPTHVLPGPAAVTHPTATAPTKEDTAAAQALDHPREDSANEGTLHTTTSAFEVPSRPVPERSLSPPTPLLPESSLGPPTPLLPERAQSQPTQHPSQALGHMEHPAVSAWRQGMLGFSFSGGGFLLPYHLGVLDGLASLGIITPGVTPLAGASAGSLAAASFHLGWHPIDDTLRNVMELSQACRTEGTKHNLDRLLKAHLHRWLRDTPDAHQLVSGCTAVAVTKMLPVARPVQISQFFSVDDLVEALAASCFLPRYSGGISTKLRGGVVADGSLIDFIPRIPTHMWETATSLHKKLSPGATTTTPSDPVSKQADMHRGASAPAAPTTTPAEEQPRTAPRPGRARRGSGAALTAPGAGTAAGNTGLTTPAATAQVAAEVEQQATTTWMGRVRRASRVMFEGSSGAAGGADLAAEAESQATTWMGRVRRASRVMFEGSAAGDGDLPAEAHQEQGQQQGGSRMGRVRRASWTMLEALGIPQPATKPKGYRVQVSCFPKRHLKALPILSRGTLKRGLDICPAEPWPYSVTQTFLLSVHPAGETFLKWLAVRGREDAMAWAFRVGLAQAAALHPPLTQPSGRDRLLTHARASSLTRALDLATSVAASGSQALLPVRPRYVKQRSVDSLVMLAMQDLPIPAYGSGPSAFARQSSSATRTEPTVRVIAMSYSGTTTSAAPPTTTLPTDAHAAMSISADGAELSQPTTTSKVHHPPPTTTVSKVQPPPTTTVSKVILPTSQTMTSTAASKEATLQERARAVVAASLLHHTTSLAPALKRVDSVPDLPVLSLTTSSGDVGNGSLPQAHPLVLAAASRSRTRRFSAVNLPMMLDGEEHQLGGGAEQQVQLVAAGWACHDPDDPHEAFKLQHDPRQPCKGYSSLAVLHRLLL